MVFRTTVHLRELDSSRLPGASQEAPRSAMVPKVDKLVALATVLPRNLVFLVSQPLFERLHSTTASHVIAVVEEDPSCAQGP